MFRTTVPRNSKAHKLLWELCFVWWHQEHKFSKKLYISAIYIAFSISFSSISILKNLLFSGRCSANSASSACAAHGFEVTTGQLISGFIFFHKCLFFDLLNGLPSQCTAEAAYYLQCRYGTLAPRLMHCVVIGIENFKT